MLRPFFVASVPVPYFKGEFRRAKRPAIEGEKR